MWFVVVRVVNGSAGNKDASDVVRVICSMHPLMRSFARWGRFGRSCHMSCSAEWTVTGACNPAQQQPMPREGLLALLKRYLLVGATAVLYRRWQICECSGLRFDKSRARNWEKLPLTRALSGRGPQDDTIGHLLGDISTQESSATDVQ